ncbi:unnamed protein product [Mortierella alpina]
MPTPSPSFIRTDSIHKSTCPDLCPHLPAGVLRSSRTLVKVPGNVGGYLVPSNDDAEVPMMIYESERPDVRQDLDSPCPGSEIEGDHSERANFSERSVPTPSRSSPSLADHGCENNLLPPYVTIDKMTSGVLQSPTITAQEPQPVQPCIQEQPEVLLEMPPPPLSNRKSRKLCGGASLNHKYNRWKDDMELWAQGSRPAYGSKSRPFTERTVRTSKRTASYLNPAMFYNHAYNPVRETDVAMLDPESSLPDIYQSEKAESPLSYYNFGSTTMQADPVMPPAAWRSISNKRSRLDNTEACHAEAEATTTCSRAIAGGPFSTPHFRVSLGTSKRARERSPEALGLSRSGPVPQGSDGGSGPDKGLGNVLFSEASSSPLDRGLTHTPASQLLHKASDQSLDFSRTPPHEPPPPLNSEGVLLDRALSSRDRIQQIGNQMRRSAAAKIARFNIPHQPLSRTVLDSKRLSGLKEVQEQDQECASDVSSTPTVPRTKARDVSGGHQNTGSTQPWNRWQYQSYASPVLLDEISSRLSDASSSVALPIISAASYRNSVYNGAASSVARPEMSLHTARLPHTAMVSHPILPQKMQRSWSATTTNTELFQAIKKDPCDQAQA